MKFRIISIPPFKAVYSGVDKHSIMRWDISSRRRKWLRPQDMLRWKAISLLNLWANNQTVYFTVPHTSVNVHKELKFKNYGILSLKAHEMGIMYRFSNTDLPFTEFTVHYNNQSGKLSNVLIDTDLRNPSISWLSDE